MLTPQILSTHLRCVDITETVRYEKVEIKETIGILEQR